MSVEDINRGERAQRLLDEPVFRTAMADSRLALLEAIELTSPQDAHAREQLYLMVRALPMVERVLRKRINDGVIAANDILAMREQEREEQARRDQQERWAERKRTAPARPSR